MGTRGDLHLVLQERMLLIGTDVEADVVRPKTFIECQRISDICPWLVQPSRRASIEHNADLAGGALIGDPIGLIGLLKRVAVRDDAIRVKVPAHQVLK